MKGKIIFAVVFCIAIIFLLGSALSQQISKTIGKFTDTFKFTFTFPDDFWQTIKDNPNYQVTFQYRKLGSPQWNFYGTIQKISDFEQWKKGEKILIKQSVPADNGITAEGTYEFRMIGAKSDLGNPNGYLGDYYFEFESNYVRLTFVGSGSQTDVGLGEPIVEPASPAADEKFEIQCPANNKGYDCIEAYSATGKQCSFKEFVLKSGSYTSLDYNAVFTCDGLPSGEYAAVCKTKTGTANNCKTDEKKISYTVSREAVMYSAPPNTLQGCGDECGKEPPLPPDVDTVTYCIKPLTVEYGNLDDEYKSYPNVLKNSKKEDNRYFVYVSKVSGKPAEININNLDQIALENLMSGPSIKQIIQSDKIKVSVNDNAAFVIHGNPKMKNPILDMCGLWCDEKVLSLASVSKVKFQPSENCANLVNSNAYYLLNSVDEYSANHGLGAFAATAFTSEMSSAIAKYLSLSFKTTPTIQVIRINPDLALYVVGSFEPLEAFKKLKETWTDGNEYAAVPLRKVGDTRYSVFLDISKHPDVIRTPVSLDMGGRSIGSFAESFVNYDQVLHALGFDSKLESGSSFIHSHPSGILSPSPADITSMAGRMHDDVIKGKPIGRFALEIIVTDVADEVAITPYSVDTLLKIADLRNQLRALRQIYWYNTDVSEAKLIETKIGKIVGELEAKIQEAKLEDRAMIEFKGSMGKIDEVEIKFNKATANYDFDRVASQELNRLGEEVTMARTPITQKIALETQKATLLEIKDSVSRDLSGFFTKSEIEKWNSLLDEFIGVNEENTKILNKIIERSQQQVELTGEQIGIIKENALKTRELVLKSTINYQEDLLQTTKAMKDLGVTFEESKGGFKSIFEKFIKSGEDTKSVLEQKVIKTQVSSLDLAKNSPLKGKLLSGVTTGVGLGLALSFGPEFTEYGEKIGNANYIALGQGIEYAGVGLFGASLGVTAAGALGVSVPAALGGLALTTSGMVSGAGIGIVTAIIAEESFCKFVDPKSDACGCSADPWYETGKPILELQKYEVKKGEEIKYRVYGMQNCGAGLSGTPQFSGDLYKKTQYGLISSDTPVSMSSCYFESPEWCTGIWAVNLNSGTYQIRGMVDTISVEPKDIAKSDYKTLIVN